MRWTALRSVLVFGLAVVCPQGPVSAHPFAPALLELEERDGAVVEVLWRTPRQRVSGAAVRPVLPQGCRQATGPRIRVEAGAVTSTWQVTCPAGLIGAQVSVDGLEASGADAVVRIALADGRTLQRVLRPGAESLVVPARKSRLDLARSYGALGVGHILGGVDHLLFVFGLLLLVGHSARVLVQTVTAFTAGHSVTLAMAVLGVVAYPTALVELGIALSIFALAVELARPPTSRPSPMRRAPWAVAGGFGLLHGFGFAGALTEAGLPQADVPLALLAFNGGIELGQLAFLGVLLAAGAALVVLAGQPPAWARQVPVYGLGCASAYWCLERAGALLS